MLADGEGERGGLWRSDDNAPRETDAENMRAVRRRRAVDDTVLALADLLNQSDKLDGVATAVLDGDFGRLTVGGPKLAQQGHAAPRRDWCLQQNGRRC